MGVPSASKARGRVSREERRVGEVDRRRRHLLAEPVHEAHRAPRRGAARRERSRPAARAASRRRAAPSPPGTRPAAAPPARPAAPALAAARSASAVGSSADGRDRHRRGVARAPAGRDADHLHVGVGGAVEGAAPGAVAHGALVLRHGPDAVGLERRAARRPRTQSASASPPSAGSSGAVSGSCPWWARAGCAAAKPGKAPGPAALAAAPRGRSARGRRRRAAPRGRVRWSRRGRRGRRPAPPARPSRRRRRWPASAGCAAKRSSSDRSRVTCASASAAGAAATAASATLEGVHRRGPHAIPTSTSRKRAGAAPCETCIDLARLALAAVQQRLEPPLRRRADGVAARPEARRLAGVAGVAHHPPELGRPRSPSRPRPRTGSAGGGRRSTTSGWCRSAARARWRRSAPRACRPRPGRGSRCSCARSAGARTRRRACSRRSGRGRSRRPSRAS